MGRGVPETSLKMIENKVVILNPRYGVVYRAVLEARSPNGVANG